MPRLMVAMLTVGGLWACGGGVGTTGPVTAPTSPSGQLSAAPDVNAGGTTAVAWNGQESHSGGSGSWFLALTQNGAQVSGNIQAFGKAGPFAGTVSGDTLSFNFSVGMGGQGCGNAFSGTATVGGRAMNGTF